MPPNTSISFLSKKSVRCFTCAILICVFVGCNEPAKWNFAQGLIAADQGETERAITLMRESVNNSPNDYRMKLELAILLAEKGDPDALPLCEEALKLIPKNPADNSYKIAASYKAEIQQHLGDFDGALATYKDLLSGNLKRDRTQRNDLAYFRALAGKELTLAANDIKTAIELEESEPSYAGRFVTLPVEAAIAIGTMARRTDEQKAMLPVLDSIINEYQRDFEIQNQWLTKDELDQNKFLFAHGDPAFSMIEFPAADNEKNLTKTEQAFHDRVVASNQIIGRCLAELLNTRALLHLDLDNTQASDLDRIRIEELGYQENDLAKWIPENYACVVIMQQAATYLDTRGYVRTKMAWSGTPEAENLTQQAAGSLEAIANGNFNFATDQKLISDYWEAKSDLDLAVSSAYMIRQAIEKSIYNSPELSAANTLQFLKRIKKTEAVLLTHRAEAHEKAGEDVAAKQDRERIKRLGFPAEKYLF